MSRRVALLIGLAVFLAGALALVAAAVYVLSPGESPGASLVGGPFALTDQDGRPVTDKDFVGKPMLVFFGFTHCPDVCPTTLYEMSQALDRLGADASRVAALFITVDPERDGPAVLKDYLSNFNPSVRGLTGAADQVTAAVRAYRAYAQKFPLQGGDYTMDHTAVVYLMDKRGRFVAPFNLKRGADEAARELRRYL